MSYLKIDKNLLDYSSWKSDDIGACGTAGTNNYFKDYTIGGVGLNIRFTGTTMFNEQDVIWALTGNTLTGNTYGGFNMVEGNFQYVYVDNTKDYRFSIWINKSVVTGTGNVYFGCWNTSGTTAQLIRNNSTGAYNKNQYFISTTPAQTNVIFPQGEWRLLVGVLRSSGTTSGSTINSYSGVYQTNGVKHTTGYTLTDLIMTSPTTGVTMKVSAPYNSITGAQAYFLYPRIDLIDGTEPSINQLLNNEGFWYSGSTSTTFLKKDDNLLDYSTWVDGTTGDTSTFKEYKSNSINYIENDLNPFNNTVPIWKNTGTATGWTGGIVAAPTTCGFSIDPSKMYRVSTWIKRKVIGSTGDMFFGVRALKNCSQDNMIKINDSSISTNHYLFASSFASMPTQFPQNVWRLLVGYIFPYTYTGGTDANYYSKVYDLTGGTVVYQSTNFKWSGSTNALYYRVYSPYKENTLSASTYMCFPRIDLVDGSEPSIQQLLSNEGFWYNPTSKIDLSDTWTTIT